jgi:xanthosine utilization system XapX-like protein
MLIAVYDQSGPVGAGFRVGLLKAALQVHIFAPPVRLSVPNRP